MNQGLAQSPSQSLGPSLEVTLTTELTQRPTPQNLGPDLTELTPWDQC